MQSWEQLVLEKDLVLDDSASTAADSVSTDQSSPQPGSSCVSPGSIFACSGEQLFEHERCPSDALANLRACNNCRAAQLKASLASLKCRRWSAERHLKDLAQTNDLKGADLQLNLAVLLESSSRRLAWSGKPTHTDVSCEDVASTNDLKAAEVRYRLASLRVQSLLDLGLPNVDLL